MNEEEVNPESKRVRLEEENLSGSHDETAENTTQEPIHFPPPHSAADDEDLHLLSQWGLTRCDLHKPVRTMLIDPTDTSSVEKPPPDPQTLQEYTTLQYTDAEAFKTDVSCPICLEPLTQTVTVMACLHRFCSECFHRSLRMELGSNSNKECPLCRLRLASRRDSRPDEAFDTLVKMLSYSHHTPAPTTPTTPSATSPRGRGRASREADAEASGDCLPNFDLDQYRRTHLENIAKFKEKQAQQKRLMASNSYQNVADSSSNNAKYSKRKLDAASSSSSSSSAIIRSNSSSSTTAGADSDLNYQHFALKSLMVAFALFPKPPPKTQTQQQSDRADAVIEAKPLTRPYIRANATVTVRDLKLLLQQRDVFPMELPAHFNNTQESSDASTIKPTISLEEIELTMPFMNDMVPLQDSYSLRDLCINFWDRKSKFEIFYSARIVSAL